jgi:hypothetical protein
MINPEDPSPGEKGPADPGTPIPEDPHETEPMHDPPIYPERDVVGVEEIRAASGNYGVESADPSPDSIVSAAIEE